MRNEVSVKEAFGAASSWFKSLPRWKKMVLIVGILLLVSGVSILVAYRYGMIMPVKTNQIVLKAKPYIGEFNTSDTISVVIFDSNLVQVASVSLKAPTWSATISGLNLQDVYYIKATMDGYYWMYWELTNATKELPDGSIAAIRNVTTSVDTIDLYFVKVGEINWVETYSFSNLADGQESIMMLIYKFNLTGFSAVENLSVIIHTNSTELNVTKINFDNATYETNDTIADILINTNAEAKVYELGLVIEENITTPVQLTVKLVYINEKGEEVEVVATEVFS